MTGPLKRKFDQLDEDSSSLCSSSSSLSSSGRRSRSCSPSSSVSPAWDSDEEGPWDQLPLPDRDFCGRRSFTPLSILKRAPRKRPGRVAFDGITVFYFPRCQGFTSVPSRGGCTLGMAPRHSACRRFSLAEFTQEQARARREKLRLRLKEEKLEALRWKASSLPWVQLAETGLPETEASPPLTVDAIDDASVEEDLAVAVAGGRLEEMTFLQPYPARRRRALLRAAGVRRIDREEKRELQALRQSREDCGCRCDRVCDPETCSCSLAGIKCQMDHTTFPCGCCREGCENPKGRVEFNQARVQTHFLHTLTRLQLEQGAESLGELEAPGQSGPTSPGDQVLAPTFPLAKPPVSSELADNSCSSDMTDSSTASGTSDAPSSTAHPALPGPGFQPDMDDDSLARVLSLSDSDLGGEEEEEEDGGVGNLDNLSCFHPADIFGTGDPGSLASWTHSYSSSSLTSGILDENANLDASFFLNSGLEGLGEGSLPGTSVLPSSDAGQSNSVDLSLSSCDSFELLQALPDYSLGPHYTSRKVSDSLDSLEAPCFPLPAFSPPGDAGACFLESIVGLPDSAAEALAPFIDSQLFEDAAPAPLVEPVPV
ncbi:cysteine/serine-rich nuclear protein 1 isoform X1 [Ursus americanus]|uniref:cysteine/serine-rich nuclear protein 1 isoform X1 n=1 Tax=Ursus americanus TaxID=9643 RepID=UPI001E67C665|nr:cysteine/serine-rich nuclear protein 1 isoform X1 [Ursus americanus]XP_045654162.1 cysteine/serine-rich nuclear protein 1 isoform X1 [Ursus americanus]XP_045654163.1 cysteine/serine-rich nuclear protein 1 isoform X1 [Ursus americanus]XP_045654164.1 cysteine/serine-rich nuclear protein 1 isoform X1 [Ursus americanus]XP_045654165.1 cysteine/serine-rich nuclear protein 1 isoform X1 [Ursus americanus]XP_045654166.1 cysteine/serine-rich nuclear protein 1 isoform X1 [Ursus americanus]